MAAITHSTVATGTDAGTGEIHKAEWNDEHVGGDFVLLESHTASSSASLDFTTRNATGQSGATFQSDYDVYVIDVMDLRAATAAAVVRLQVSDDGGSSYKTSGYSWSQNNVIIGGTTTGSNGAGSAASIQLWGDSAGVGQGTGATNTMSGTFRLFNPLGTATFKYLRGEGIGHYNTNSSWYQFSMGGFWYNSGSGTGALNAFRVLYSSGNITSGIVRVYGIGK